MDLEGRVALVTGAAHGMGRAAAKLLGANGACVALLDVNVDGLQQVYEDLTGEGCSSIALPVDISRAADVDRAVAETVGRFGRLDIVVNCAAAAPWRRGGDDDAKRLHTVLDMSDDEWHRMLAIDLDGPFYLSRAAGRVMVEQGSGTIILIASDRALYGKKGGAHYAAAKDGVIAFVKSMALEVGRHNVTINALNPGATNTHEDITPERRLERIRFDPLGTMCEPEDIAETILFLASRGGRYMTGQLITTRMTSHVS
jgi:NAD(P)-dependent dehydrogenase (short-subunit alcohol dehydrogenase family)